MRASILLLQLILVQLHVAGAGPTTKSTRGGATSKRNNGGGSNVSKASKTPLNEETFKTPEEKHQRWRLLITTLFVSCGYVIVQAGGLCFMFTVAI